MPKLKPQSMAYDVARDVTYLYATHGKDRWLLELSQSMALTAVRKIPALSDIFWVVDGVAVFWKIEKSVVVPLAPDAKTRSIPGKLDWRSIASPALGKYSVLEDNVVRFDGTGWAECDAEGYMLRGSLRGAWQRTLRPGEWKPLVEQAPSSVHTTLAISGDRSHWLIAASSGTFLSGVGTPNARKTEANWAWCAIGFGDRFFTSRNNRVWSIDLDGKQVDAGVGADDPPDHALFACGARAFYLTGTSTLYRHQAGDWTAHDIAAAGAAVGLG